MATDTAAPRYRVTGPCVIVKTGGLAGMHASHVRSIWTGVTLYRNALLPDDVPAETIARLLDANLIAPFEEVDA
jgi:hypothetical protein